jgi:predicted ATPase
MYHTNRGEIDLGRRLAEDLIQRSEDQAQNTGLVLGHLCLGATLMVRGEFSESRLNLMKVDSLCEPAGGRVLVQEAGIHPRTMCRAFLGFIDLCLGYPDRSLAFLAAAIAEAGSEQHPPSVLQGRSMKAKVLCLRGDTAQLAQDAEQIFAIGVDQGFPFWRATGSIYRGWVKVMTGGSRDGISELREGIGAFQKTGARVWMPHFQALQAEAEAIGGNRDVALGILREALQTSRERGENWFEAELVRRRGELIRDREPAAAEVMFEEAIRIARRQDAKLWELRAAVSLARLRRDQGRGAEVRDLLAPVYGWFTEGFDTHDLKDAKALLDELA